jgi:hypothetical protein
MRSNLKGIGKMKFLGLKIGVICSLLCVVHAFSADYIWNGIDGDWNDTMNWSGGELPPSVYQASNGCYQICGATNRIIFAGGVSPAGDIPEYAGSPENTPCIELGSNMELSLTNSWSQFGDDGISGESLLDTPKLLVGTNATLSLVRDSNFSFVRAPDTKMYFKVLPGGLLSFQSSRIDFSYYERRTVVFELDGGQVQFRSASDGWSSLRVVGTRFGNDISGSQHSLVSLNHGSLFYIQGRIENNMKDAAGNPAVVFDLCDTNSSVLFHLGGFYPDLASVSNDLGSVFLSSTIDNKYLEATESNGWVTVSLYGQDPLPCTYEHWLEVQGLGGAYTNLFDDPDNDSFCNLAEYALGSNPQSPSSAVRALQVDRASNGLVCLSFPARENSSDLLLLYRVERNDSLLDFDGWTTEGILPWGSGDPMDGFLIQTNLDESATNASCFYRLCVQYGSNHWNAGDFGNEEGGGGSGGGGSGEGGTTNATRYLTTSSLINFDPPTASNLLVNGSFELGLGAEPIYPGWIQTDPRGSLTPPSHPVVTTETASEGTRCLKISNIIQGQRVILDFKPPCMGSNGNCNATLALDVKSDGNNMGVIMPGFAWHSIGTSWKRVTRTLSVDAIYPIMRVDFTNSSTNPATLYVDGISWTADASSTSNNLRSASAEATLIPQHRDGIYDAGTPIILQYAVNADHAKTIGMELHLRDLTRGGIVTIPWEATSYSVSPASQSGFIQLGELKPGAYMALLGLYDPATSNLISVAREKFTVMSSLQGIPAPINFFAGTHGGGARGFSSEVDFSNRGAWTLDEYYQTAWRTGVRVQRLIAEVAALMPESNQIDFSDIKPDIYAASRNGCTTVLCADTFRVKAQGSVAPTNHYGDWVFVEGLKAPDEVTSDSYDFYLMPSNTIDSLYQALGSEFKGKLLSLEVVNELNMFVKDDHMDWIVDNLYRPAYQAFKPQATNTPVVVNFTMDFYIHPSFTQCFFRQGGLDGTDGFSYHPYGRRILVEELSNGNTGYGFDYMDLNNTFKTEIQTNTTKTINMGMSEIHAIGTFITPGWDLMQRILVDWVGGADWSAGVLYDGLCFLEARGMSAWRNRGPRAPGIGAVALNAMYSVLGGFRCIERIDLDHGVLIGLFENPTTGEKAVALANGYYNTLEATLDVDFAGMTLKVYDQWGAPCRIATPILLSREIIYIKSSEPGFADAFRNATLHFSTAPPRPIYQHNPAQFSPGPDSTWYQELLRTGLPPVE